MMKSESTILIIINHVSGRSSDFFITVGQELLVFFVVLKCFMRTLIITGCNFASNFFN